MNKKIVIAVVITILVVAVVGLVFVLNNDKGSAVAMETAQDLEGVINTINANVNSELASLMTNVVDVTDSESVSFFTGLESNENVEAVVVSEPMMTSQAYSFVLVKVSENADVESMKQQMLDNIDTRKWICVTAEKVYVTNHENLICLVMAREELAKPVYNEFKSLVDQKIGKELEKTEQI